MLNDGTGKPERLKHDYHGYWSRRINREHHLVYAIEEGRVVVTIVSAYGYYER
ncbi:Txe/YoeB family addiction module toxin [Echinicola soli]|uniref:Putative mRNA interferase YoeB n=1 Tax=Echinicola soli TaxID=2591634 RepID=A0A514CP50_9BACT|nr:Txe/YoeB family addiction module toxin [Echinicola soli]QDH81570.1 Txe/YoeB family addiction module toxin [Echinicola soli]